MFSKLVCPNSTSIKLVMPTRRLMRENDMGMELHTANTRKRKIIILYYMHLTSSVPKHTRLNPFSTSVCRCLSVTSLGEEVLSGSELSCAAHYFSSWLSKLFGAGSRLLVVMLQRMMVEEI